MFAKKEVERIRERQSLCLHALVTAGDVLDVEKQQQTPGHRRRQLAGGEQWVAQRPVKPPCAVRYRSDRRHVVFDVHFKEMSTHHDRVPARAAG